MKARQLVGSASLGPDALKIAYQAFDDAWAEIAANYGTNPIAIEAGRLRLANAVLSVVDDQCTDAAALKDAALKILALKNPPKSAASSKKTGNGD